MKKILKYLYSITPFKKQLYFLFRFIFRPKESIYKHLYFNGVFTAKVDDTHSFKIKHHGHQIENELFWAGLYNAWEKESMKLWISLSKTAETIVDVGANTGIYSLVSQAINPKAKVFAFEPIKKNYNKLASNIKLNNFPIVSIEKALSNNTGEAIVYDVPEKDIIYSVTIGKNFNDPGVATQETEIETITLDDFIIENNISKIDLIKIDVESHEPEVLEGFKNNLAKFKPTIFIEILSNEAGKRVEKVITGLGYLYFDIDEKKGIRQVDKITKSAYYNYLLCNEKIAKQLNLI